MTKLRESDLGNLVYLAEGAFAKVYRVDGFLLPSDSTPLAYKQFTVEHAAQGRSAAVSVKFRDDLDVADRADLDQYTAWPRALVHDSLGAVCGLLMALIPPPFFCRQPDDTGKMTSKPREMGWLASSADQRAAAQVDIGDVDRTERLLLLAQLVYILGRLHKHGWVFGDLSFGNVAFALDPPRTMLLDCDGAAPLADKSRKQASTPFWDPPECASQPPPGTRRPQDLLDDVTDVYKLGLAVLRCLTPGKGAASTRVVGRLIGELDAAGLDLVTRALSDDRAVRPTAKELYSYLRQVVAARVRVPEVTMAHLVTPQRVRGQDVTIEWRVSYTTEIEITSGNGTKLTVDPAAHPNGYSFRPDVSGQVLLDVRNRFGSAVVDLGVVELFELPPFKVDLNYLPRPEIPPMTAFSVPSLAATIEGRPLVGVGGDVLKIPALNVLEFIQGLAPSPHISGAMRDATDSVRDAIRQESQKMAPMLRRTFISRNSGEV